MRHRFIGGALLAAAALVSGPVAARAQSPGHGQYPITFRGQAPADIGGLNPPINADPTIPIPTGASGSAGFYTSAEFVMLTQTRAIGDQIIAYRGFVDSTGSINGIPGIYNGSGFPALTTGDLGRTTWNPGYKVELGYKFEDGTTVFANWMQLADAHYNVSATLVPPYFRSAIDLSDTFLVAGVYNFPPQYAGPAQDTTFDPPGALASNTYGIWNAADVMTLRFTQRFSQADAGIRTPLFMTEYSRVYGVGGFRYAWFFERFQWYTADYDTSGIVRNQDVAWYTNTLSQRMYGPFVGCGHEIFIANEFSLSADLTGSLLLNVIKERNKYKLETRGSGGTLNPVASKRSFNEYSVVPNANVNLNLWWYPVEGVQVRVGYAAMAYFNTRRMEEPVGFNYGAIDPQYDTQYFRLLHGVNVGIGLFF
jgi:hypothetical protein